MLIYRKETKGQTIVVHRTYYLLQIYKAAVSEHESVDVSYIRDMLQARHVRAFIYSNYL